MALRTPDPRIKREIAVLDTYNDTFGYKFCDRTEKQTKIDTLICLLQDPDIQNSLKSIFNMFMATSDLKVLKRLAIIEEKLGIEDYGIDKAPTIHERLDILESKVNTPTITLEPVLEPKIQPTTKTEKRACVIVSKLRKCKKRFLTSAEIIHFLKHDIPEDIRIPENTCNPREIKKEVLEKAAELFPDVKLSKRSHGRREVRILVS